VDAYIEGLLISLVASLLAIVVSILNTWKLRTVETIKPVMFRLKKMTQ